MQIPAVRFQNLVEGGKAAEWRLLADVASLTLRRFSAVNAQQIHHFPEDS